ncbi:MBL fold metallo-hydrolase [Corallococcus praedator]|uniref:MBL fold metallo-hydrolase n=2 Tax=Myxococcaceae TaxID=31 RepID=A0ABX9QBG9_9BACT|nr:MBL fold metallo-hydrolase [Corallococcus sp. CA047B]RKH31345.1 MBL fold metallo-hydrolase [Corallococcus sp. CA031C]RKH96348.1 MBL fold metallo-hydrolase [Corallococcus praedator]
MLAGAPLLPSAVHAAAPQVRTQSPGYHRMLLGDFEVTVLSDGTVPQTVSEVATRTTPERVRELLSRDHLADPVELSINAFVINTGTALVLVDTGVGGFFGPGVGGQLQQSLRAAGYQPEQIDVVLLTHIHSDHSGGLMSNVSRAFPNAILQVHAREAGFWLGRENTAKGPVDPKYFEEARAMVGPYQVAGKLKTFGDGDTLVPGIRAMSTPGHTPGHSAYVVESRGQRLALWGDLMHFGSVQLREPSVTVAYDIDERAAAAQRARAFTEAARRGDLIGLAHMPFPGLGRLSAEGKGYRWIPVNYSSGQRWQNAQGRAE